MTATEQAYQIRDEIYALELRVAKEWLDRDEVETLQRRIRVLRAHVCRLEARARA